MPEVTGARTRSASSRARLLGLLVAVAACSRSAPPPPPDPPRAPASALATALQPTPEPAPDARLEPAADAAPDPAGTYLGRTLAAPMSHLGAAWLDRPDRDRVQQPEHVLDVLGVREGQTVADVGCGSGYFTVHLASRVGPRGRVYATDLQPEMLALLAKKTGAERLTNVVPLLATADDAKLPAGALDLVLLVDVYHELPRAPVTLAQIARSLAPTGQLALVEYRAEDPAVAIKPEHKMTLAQIRKELGANGWTFVASDESLPEQRIVRFRR